MKIEKVQDAFDGGGGIMEWPDDFIGKVIQGDCLDVMRDMPDKCVDLVLADPPYGIGEAAGKNKSRGKLAVSKDYGNDSWDNERPSADIFREIIRISKNQIIFGGNYFADLLPPSSCWIVWDKLNGKTDFADCELAWTSFDTAVRRLSFQWQGMLQGDMKNKEEKFHPTQKPIPVFRWILDKYAQDGQVIFDPFAGGGTTALACDSLGLRWSLVEREEKYCDIARKRISDEQAQGKLF